MSRPASHKMRRAGFAVIIAGVLTGCGTSAPAPARDGSPLAFMGGHAALGHLEISRAYIPAPATPSLGAAYFTVTNTGPADRLVSVRTSAFRTASLHRYRTLPDGAERMVPVAHGGVIPAHGRLVLMPGSDHLMLRRPRHPVEQGAMERMTLRFQHAGTVSMEVPVVAATGLPGTSDTMDMSGMTLSGGSK